MIQTFCGSWMVRSWLEYADIHGVVQNQLFSAVSAWNGDLNILLPVVFGVVQDGHKGVLKAVLMVLE